MPKCPNLAETFRRGIDNSKECTQWRRIEGPTSIKFKIISLLTISKNQLNHVQLLGWIWVLCDRLCRYSYTCQDFEVLKVDKEYKPLLLHNHSLTACWKNEHEYIRGWLCCLLPPPWAYLSPFPSSLKFFIMVLCLLNPKKLGLKILAIFLCCHRD